ncbi:MAG: type II secretion system protein [Chthoniobacterales bacterium]|nr:type II secretion system protein [Chthoniobacterales bacterium]
MSNLNRRARAFTLIELLVVITIIAILMGLLFPAFKGVQTQAKRTQAKNDLTQLVNGINAYYTEYGKYPILSSDPTPDATFGESDPKTSLLMDVLRADSQARDDPAGVNNLNPKRIQFVQWPIAKDFSQPRNGIGMDGQPYDPWGKTYIVRIDADYDNAIQNPYTASTGAGFNPIGSGCIAWSFGPDNKGGSGAKTSTDSDDDLISWQ